MQPLSETCSSWVFFITVHQSLKFPPWGFVKYYFRCYEVFLHAQLVLYLYICPLKTQITFFSLTRPRHHLQFYLITTCRGLLGSFSIILQSGYLYSFEFAIGVGYILSWHGFPQKAAWGLCLIFVQLLWQEIRVANRSYLCMPDFFTFIFFRKVTSTLPPVIKFVMMDTFAPRWDCSFRKEKENCAKNGEAKCTKGTSLMQRSDRC